MKASHVFWALLIVCLMFVVPMLALPRSKVDENGSAAYLLLFVSLWGIVLLASPVMMVLAKLRILSAYQSFTFTLAFILNLYFGLFCIFQFISGVFMGISIFLTLVFSGLDFIWAAILVFGLCVKKYDASQRNPSER